MMKSEKLANHLFLGPVILGAVIAMKAGATPITSGFITASLQYGGCFNSSIQQVQHAGNFSNIEETGFGRVLEASADYASGSVGSGVSTSGKLGNCIFFDSGQSIAYLWDTFSIGSGGDTVEVGYSLRQEAS